MTVVIKYRFHIILVRSSNGIRRSQTTISVATVTADLPTTVRGAVFNKETSLSTPQHALIPFLPVQFLLINLSLHTLHSGERYALSALIQAEATLSELFSRLHSHPLGGLSCPQSIVFAER